MKNHFFSTRKSLLTISSILLTICLFTSCLNDNNDEVTPPDVAGFMAFNLAPDQAVIGVSLSGNELNTALPYTSYTGGYVRIYPGKRSTSAFDASTGNIFATAIHTYKPNKFYSLFVTGAKGTYKNIIVNDNLDTLAGIAGKSYIRYINAIPDSSMPTITISEGQNNIINEQAAFTHVSNFVLVNSDSVKVGINNDSTIQKWRSINLEERKTYTVLFIGNPAGSSDKDSIQIRYVENATLMLDSTAQNISEGSE